MEPEINLLRLRRDCPPMIIARQKGIELEENFNNNYNILNSFYSPFTIYKEVFHNLLEMIKDDDLSIDGFRIYLGFEENKIKFIFNGLRNDQDVESYFLLKENGLFKPINQNQASDLVNNYQKDIYPKTTTIIPDNTKSYLYRNGLIDKFLNELNVQEPNRDMKGLRIKFGAYTDNAINPNSNDFPDYINRIIIGFSFIRSNNQEIGLNEISSNIYGCEIRNGKSELIGADTGTPCPPNNCGGTSLPK